MLKIPGYKYLGIILGVFFLVTLLYHGRLSDYDEGRYHDAPPDDVIAANKIKFEESSKAYGLDGVRHEFFFPNDSDTIKRFRELITILPGISVIDFNGDGYMDFFYSVPQPDQPNRLFINEEGKRFVEITDQLSFLAKKGEHGSNFGIWADFNEDGLLDVFDARSGCHAVFIQKEQYAFEELEGAVEYCSMPQSINILDFNLDGHLDLLFANYYSIKDLENYEPPIQTILGNAGIGGKNRGGKNALLLGDGTGRFEKADIAAFEKEDANFSQGAGVSYINDDHYPDIFIANDYYYDEMYLNDGGKQLQRVTNEYIPRHLHGWSGMNSEFIDYNMDGLVDLYVSNGWEPPSAPAKNLLWQKKAHAPGFENVAEDENIFKCGWGWGAKFSDYDLDGDLDLFVTNGRARGSKAESFDQSRSFVYLRAQVRSMPQFLRERTINRNDNIVPEFNNSNWQLYGFERNCVFLNHEGSFYDVAPVTGVDDLENGNSLALVDIDNDGKQDLLIGNADGPLLFYKNQSKTEGAWIGFHLLNDKKQIYHGAVLYGVRSDGKPIIRELFVMNGFRGQNDPRIHLGLGNTSLRDNQVMIHWPDGTYEQFDGLQVNQYNELVYGTGQKQGN